MRLNILLSRIGKKLQQIILKITKILFNHYRLSHMSCMSARINFTHFSHLYNLVTKIYFDYKYNSCNRPVLWCSLLNHQSTVVPNYTYNSNNRIWYENMELFQWQICEICHLEHLIQVQKITIQGNVYHM